jgi:LacI family transcriptional regulator
MKRATITDVAKLAGVSIKTVSRVANGEAHVSDATRRKVAHAIDSLAYQADEHARHLGARRHAELSGDQHNSPQLHAISRTDDPLRIDWD